LNPPDDPEEGNNAPPAPSSIPGRAATRQRQVRARLDSIAQAIAERFQQSHRVLSFQQYLELYASDPVRHGRCAPRYVRDMFRHYGTETVEQPWGELTRFRLFDAPWQQGQQDGAAMAAEATLVGQEALQGEIYRTLCNFAREGRANRLVLMQGPNGSSKSTVAACILRALEHYSTEEEGALYRFHWVFPKRPKGRGAIGFGSAEPSEEPSSYAHLGESDIDARLVIELRDHPLFLLPPELRQPLVEALWQEVDDPEGEGPSPWLYHGELSHKNKLIYEALLKTYDGSLGDVLRHVQVERYFVSRRYRVGAVTLGPQMHVDAGERQISADRSVSALPTFLQATTLFEAHGELVDASGGVLELSDLLKRPIDAFRYLQITLETGQASLSQQIIFTNLVMIGSANDIHVAAFREHPEYPSFRGRIELVRAPYLRSYHDEQRIYDSQIVPHVQRHVAPYATQVAAEFAVLSRMLAPDKEQYPEELGDVVRELSAADKMVLYADGTPPERLTADQRRRLRASIEAIYRETEAAVDYEGRQGVSPRTMRGVLLDAAQSEEYACLSPFAVLKGIDEVCKRTAEYAWLRLEAAEAGYHDHQGFREQVRSRLVDRLEADLRTASGLIEPRQYDELFGRYIHHVSTWVKGEKVHNPVTGEDESPDEQMMRDVEQLLGVESEPEEHRRGLISMIAAWAIDNPGEAARHPEVFPGYVDRLQTAAFARLRKPFALLLRDIVTLLRDDGAGLSEGRRREIRTMVDHSHGLGYCDGCALDAASSVLRERYRDLVT